MQKVSVLKFGGSSVATIEKIKAISNYLKKRVDNGEKLVVVLSAMGKTTDSLLKQAAQITSKPDIRELDSLLSIGEQNTISLMAINLNHIGVTARSLTGMQAGIKTFGQHTKSKIANINHTFILQELEKFDVLVVAGFQGVNEKKEITTLGRGGSDTSAVALAAALSSACEIYTDVTGVFKTDPRIYPKAGQLYQITYEEMLELSALGAGVLERRCVEIAKNYRVPLYLAKTLSNKKGTWIMENIDLLEKKVVTGVALDKDILHVRLSCNACPTNFVELLFDELDKESVNIDMISQILVEKNLTISFTCKKTDRQFLENVIRNLSNDFPTIENVIKDDCTKLSIVGSGMRDVSGVAARAFRIFFRNNIDFYQVTTSEISISYAINEKDAEKTLELFCKEFNI